MKFWFYSYNTNAWAKRSLYLILRNTSQCASAIIAQYRMRLTFPISGTYDQRYNAYEVQKRLSFQVCLLYVLCEITEAVVKSGKWDPELNELKYPKLGIFA